MRVRIRTGLEVARSNKQQVFCKNVDSYEGDSEDNATAKFLMKAFQDLEDRKITSVLITRSEAEEL